jgi:hypothetical protein
MHCVCVTCPVGAAISSLLLNIIIIIVDLDPKPETLNPKPKS